MTTVIARKFEIHISAEVRQRAKEHLAAKGYDVNRIQPLEWPEGAISASKEHRSDRWRFVFKSDVLRAKKERMEHALWIKREYHRCEVRALYVWVFYCPGIANSNKSPVFGGFFEGWWAYLKGIGRDYDGGGRKNNVTGRLLEIIMELFPLAPQGRLFSMEPDEWMPLFARKYQRGRWCGRPQGKAPVWAEVRGNSVKRIIGKANWPDVCRR